MGRESRVIKRRLCPHCNKFMRNDAIGQQNHAALCKRAVAAGLVIPEPPDLGEAMGLDQPRIIQL